MKKQLFTSNFYESNDIKIPFINKTIVASQCITIVLFLSLSLYLSYWFCTNYFFLGINSTDAMEVVRTFTKLLGITYLIISISLWSFQFSYLKNLKNSQFIYEFIGIAYSNLLTLNLFNLIIMYYYRKKYESVFQELDSNEILKNEISEIYNYNENKQEIKKMFKKTFSLVSLLISILVITFCSTIYFLIDSNSKITILILLSQILISILMIYFLYIWKLIKTYKKIIADFDYKIDNLRFMFLTNLFLSKLERKKLENILIRMWELKSMDEESPNYEQLSKNEFE